MANAGELIRSEADGSISFGDHTLKEKTKRLDFEHNGDLYKVKTYNEITKLEKNGMFVYESVPGTTVTEFFAQSDSMSFVVEGAGDVQITVEMEEGISYVIKTDGEQAGFMEAALGGKLSLSLELEPGQKMKVEIVRAEDR